MICVISKDVWKLCGFLKNFGGYFLCGICILGNWLLFGEKYLLGKFLGWGKGLRCLVVIWVCFFLRMCIILVVFCKNCFRIWFMFMGLFLWDDLVELCGVVVKVFCVFFFGFRDMVFIYLVVFWMLLFFKFGVILL